MTVALQKGKTWYRQMAFPGVEFQLQGRNADKTHRLAVRSVKDEALVAQFDIEDPNASKDLYLRAAEGQFLNEILERGRKLRDQRRKQHVPDLRPALGDQVLEGQERKSEGAAEGRHFQNDQIPAPVVRKPSGKSRRGNQEGNKAG